MIGPPPDLPGLAPGGRPSPRAWGKFKRHFWGRSLRYQQPAQHAIAIGSANRSWRTGTGSSIASGAPTGFVGRRTSSGDWSRRSRRPRSSGRSVIGKPEGPSRRRPRKERSSGIGGIPRSHRHHADHNPLCRGRLHGAGQPRAAPAVAGADAEMVGQIVEIEGPIHRDEIARRVTRVCGYTRTGRRIVDAVAAGLRSAERRGLVAHDRDFLQFVAEMRRLSRPQ